MSMILKSTSMQSSILSKLNSGVNKIKRNNKIDLMQIPVIGRFNNFLILIYLNASKNTQQISDFLFINDVPKGDLAVCQKAKNQAY